MAATTSTYFSNRVVVSIDQILADVRVIQIGTCEVLADPLLFEGFGRLPIKSIQYPLLADPLPFEGYGRLPIKSIQYPLVVKYPTEFSGRSISEETFSQ
jgi:hypothetical protein